MNVSYTSSLKDSGVTWIGKIPKHWKAVKLKFTCLLIRDGTHLPPPRTETGFPLLSVRNIINGKLTLLSDDSFISEKDFYALNKSFTPQENDVLLAIVGATLGKVAVVKKMPPFQIQRSLAIFRSHQSSLSYQFLNYFFQSKIFQELLWKNVGFSAQPGIYLGALANFHTTVPPVKEQGEIVDFLDRKTAAIDVLITKKQRLIELLEEKRSALINQAVTKGLNPDAPMKDSGIPWIGKVPEHWEIRRFRHCGHIKNGQVDPKLSRFADLPLYAPNYIISGSGELLENVESAAEQGAISGKYLVEEGEIIYSKIRPELRKVCIAPKSGLCSADMYAIAPVKDVKSKFLFWSLLSESFSQLAILESERVAMPKINRETLSDVPFAIPPENEQEEIIEFIDKQTTVIYRICRIISSQIERLQEYRQSVITAAVTGKLDVTQAAAP